MELSNFIKEERSKGKLNNYEMLRNLFDRLYDEKWRSYFDDKIELKPETGLKICVQGEKNLSELEKRSANCINGLLDNFKEDELIKTYKLLSTFEELKKAELSRLNGVKQLSGKNHQFESMSTKKAQNTDTQKAVLVYESISYDQLVKEKSKHQIVDLVFNKLVSADKDEFKKAVELKLYLIGEYTKQLDLVKPGEHNLKKELEKKLDALKKIDEAFNEKSLLEAYKIDQGNKSSEKDMLTKNNQTLKNKVEFFENNLIPQVEWKIELNGTQYKRLLENIVDRFEEIRSETYTILKNSLVGRASERELNDMNSHIMGVITNNLPQILSEELAKFGLLNNSKEYLREIEGKVISIYKHRQNSRESLKSFKNDKVVNK